MTVRQLLPPDVQADIQFTGGIGRSNVGDRLRGEVDHSVTERKIRKGL